MTRRRIYLLRHGQVAYFVDGRPVGQDDVPLTDEGRRESEQTAAALAGVTFDRVITSGLPRAVETARIVAPESEPEAWPELREIEAGRLADLSDPEGAFVGAYRGIVPEDDEVPRRRDDRLAARPRAPRAASGWPASPAGTSRSSSRTAARSARSSPTRSRAAARSSATSSSRPRRISILDVGDDWIVRAVNVTPYDLTHTRTRLRTMEELWAQYKSM